MNEILTHVDAGVTTLTINRVEKKNSLTAAMYAALAQGIAQAAQDSSQRVLVIQGHETVFSAGNDVADFLNQPPTGTDAPVFHFLQGIATFPKPLLAAVCGPAVGVGTTMLLHCDLVYAGDNAAFSMPFVNLGLCPEAASSLLVPRLMGHQGLVNRVLPPTEASAYAQQQARKLAAKPLSSLIETKRLLKGAQTPAVLERMQQEGAIFRRMLTEPAAKEAFGAFLQKRKPDFSKL